MTDLDRLAAALEHIANWRTKGPLYAGDAMAMMIYARRALDSLPRDPASRYGELLAQRDRLIAAGADPADLLVPEPPEAA